MTDGQIKALVEQARIHLQEVQEVQEISNLLRNHGVRFRIVSEPARDVAINMHGGQCDTSRLPTRFALEAVKIERF